MRSVLEERQIRSNAQARMKQGLAEVRDREGRRRCLRNHRSDDAASAARVRAGMASDRRPGEPCRSACGGCFDLPRARQIVTVSPLGNLRQQHILGDRGPGPRRPPAQRFMRCRPSSERLAGRPQQRDRKVRANREQTGSRWDFRGCSSPTGKNLAEVPRTCRPFFPLGDVRPGPHRRRHRRAAPEARRSAARPGHRGGRAVSGPSRARPPRASRRRPGRLRRPARAGCARRA